jgi:hypothetical protein
MQFNETDAVYCEYTKHSGRNAEFCCIKAGGIYSNHWDLKYFY